MLGLQRRQILCLMIYTAFFSSEKEDENYFLGSIVLIKETANRRSDVIDGQQRLTTLTILFSVLADNLTDPRKSVLHEKITGGR